MRRYEYQAVGPTGERQVGLQLASSVGALDAELEERGFTLTRARPARRASRARRARLSRAELIEFASALATLHGAGVSLADGLSGLIGLTRSVSLAALYRRCLDALEEGSSLSEALAREGSTFPPEFLAAVRAGEASGSLDRVLIRLVRHLEWSQEMRATTQQALVYPAVLTLAVVALVAILFLHVVPNVVELFPGGRADLPSETRALLAVSDALVAGAVPLGLSLVLVVGGLLAARTWTPAAERLHRLVLRLPVLGRLAGQLAVSRFASTAAVLKGAGCDALTLLRLAAGSVGNRAVERALLRAVERVERGRSLSEALSAERAVDPLLVQVVGVGEASGALGDALDRLSEHYDREVPRRVRRTLAFLEPALLLVAGVVVTAVLLAVLLPVFEVYDHLG